MTRFALDHIVYAVPDLDRECEAFASGSGCTPVPGGPHLGLGTRNALVSFGDSVYLELIGPDVDRDLTGTLGARLAELPASKLFAWALRHDDLSALAERLRANGFTPTPVTETTRKQPDGETLVWELLGCIGRGGAWPFFIDWRETAHPSLEAPRVGGVLRVEVSLPVDDVATLPFSEIPGVTLIAGEANLTVAFESPRGPIEWSSTDPDGFFRAG